MVVVIDENALDRAPSAEGTILRMLFDHEYVQVWHHADDGPPADIAQLTQDRRDTWAPYWLVHTSLERVSDRGTPSFLYATEVGGGPGITGSWIDLDQLAQQRARIRAAAGEDYAEALAHTGRDLLCLLAADAIRADIVITDRGDPLAVGIRGAGVRALSLRDGIAIVSLYLRAQGVYILGPYGGTQLISDRAGFYFIGSREVVRAADEWVPQSVSDANTRSGVFALRNAMFQRFDRVLRNRDRLHVALVSGSEDEAMEALDVVLVFLMAALDSLARAAHLLHGLDRDAMRRAGWQKSDWLSQPAIAANSRLTALIAPRTRGSALLFVTSRLRNTIHEVAFHPVRILGGGQRAFEVMVPERDDRHDILGGLELLGGATSWGVKTTHDGRLQVEPGIFTEHLVAGVGELLNSLASHMPITRDAASPARANREIDAWHVDLVRLQLSVGN